MILYYTYIQRPYMYIQVTHMYIILLYDHINCQVLINVTFEVKSLNYDYIIVMIN